MKVLKSKNKPQPVELEKRTYLPGYRLKDKCPECGKVWEQDLAQDYLSYPSTESPVEIHAYCRNDDCQHEWIAGEVIIRITLEAAP